MVPHTNFKDTLASTLARELIDISMKREKQRARDAKNTKLSTSEVIYNGDRVGALSVSISIPAGPPWHVDEEQTLLSVNDDTLKLKTALEDYHQLAVFMERHYWSVTSMTVEFHFRTAIGTTALVQSIRKCLRMLVSLDRNMLVRFKVGLASVDTILFKDDRDEILKKALAMWIAGMYMEMDETRKAGVEIEGLYSSRKRVEGDPKEEGFKFGFEE